MIEQSTALTLDPKDIARAELARWRRRLGPLTSEQEEKIESVLMSIAIRTSQLATTVMDSLLSAGQLIPPKEAMNLIRNDRPGTAGVLACPRPAQPIRS